MAEHRLIERMVRLMSTELDKIGDANRVDTGFVDACIDFLRTYADRCHHGKEEGILFRELSEKNISPEHRAIMQKLIDEHAIARRTVSSLEDAKGKYVGGNVEPIKDISRLVNELIEFYPRHIEKEDKRFFYPCMEYLTAQEKDHMLQEFLEFDRKLIHEKYMGIVETLEKSGYAKMPQWRCRICGYVYDPGVGDPGRGIKPGTPFEDLPQDWRCPVCNAPKTEFEKMALRIQ